MLPEGEDCKNSFHPMHLNYSFCWTEHFWNEVSTIPNSSCILNDHKQTQGQLVNHVGLDLQTDISAHGQLYVALSQYTSSQQIKALFKNEANVITKILYTVR